MLGRIDRGKVTVWSRNEKEWTAKFLNVVESVKKFPLTTAILDGEIVMVDAQGHSSFQKLQRAMSKSATSAFVYEVFDLIYLDGYDLTRVQLTERKRLLKDCAPAVVAQFAIASTSKETAMLSSSTLASTESGYRLQAC